jgi:predicted DCC family thiol-disulfide oxidoreductase YuxK
VQTWTNGRIEPQPWQAIPERMAQLGLTDKDGLAQAWFAPPTGKLTGGAEAINEAMRYCWWARPFTYLYQLPGIKQVEDWLYRWVADNRYRMPGSTAACEIGAPSEK